jgi:hypothetical protein
MTARTVVIAGYILRVGTARDGFLHELPKGTSKTRCGQWAELEVQPPTTQTRWLSWLREAVAGDCRALGLAWAQSGRN